MNRDQKRLVLIAVVVGLWVVFLAVLAIRTANPIVVARPRVKAADVVARVRVLARTDEGLGVEVLERLKGQADAKRIDIRAHAAATPGRTYYVLLEATKGYRLLAYNSRLWRNPSQGTRVLVPGEPALLPDTDFVRRQLVAAIDLHRKDVPAPSTAPSGPGS